MRGESRSKGSMKIVRERKGRWEGWRRICLTFRAEKMK
jgi:hypothetical protein